MPEREAGDVSAVAVERVDLEVEPTDDDVGEAVAVDVADRGRRHHAVGVAVRTRRPSPLVAVVAALEAPADTTVGVEHDEAAVLIDDPRGADRHDDLFRAVV